METQLLSSFDIRYKVILDFFLAYSTPCMVMYIKIHVITLATK